MPRSSAPAVVLLLTLCACSSIPPRAAPLDLSRGHGEPTALDRLEALADAGQSHAALELAEQELLRATDPAERAQLEILAARALSADGRQRSALLHYGRAQRELPDGFPDLARAILHGRGDAELALGEAADAARDYQLALASGRAPAREHNDLQHAIYLALREAGDPGAEAWKRGMEYFSNTRLARLEHELLAGRGPAPTPSRPSAAPGGIPGDPREILARIHPRADWHARPIRGDYDPMTPITHATVHHSAMVSYATAPAQVGAELLRIQADHQAKWADIGYHFLIDRAGGVWEGRALRWQGAHEGAGLNQGAIGICLLGDFEVTSPPRAQLGALRELLDACEARFHLTSVDIKTHREVRREPTACPGRALQAWVDEYRHQGALASLARQ